jgi:hypothetical protein
MPRSRASAPRRAAALLLATFGGALLPVCSAGTGELPSPAASGAPPSLIIEFEGSLPRSAGEGSGELPSQTQGAFEDIRARLQLGETTAVAKLDIRGRPPASAVGGKVQIDVRVKGKQRLFGMRRFSLRDPAAVDFQNEPLVFEHLRREGVLAPRILFVRATTNGDELGLMALEEHFSKELLESQRRRAGVIFRLRSEALPVARVDAFDGKKIEGSKQVSAERANAAGLLQAFLRGELPARDVFDVELMARLLAVAELWQADALLHPENLRFYFNPVSQRIEPIGFDGRPRVPPGSGARMLGGQGWSSQLLADAELRAAFFRNLARLAGEMASGELPRWLAAEEDPLLRALRSEVASRAPIDLDPWIARARSLSRLAEADPTSTDEPPARDGSAGRERLIAAGDVASRRHNPIPKASLEEVLERHSFLEWDGAQRTLRAAPGTWSVRGSLVLPEGAGLDLDAGTTLRFGEGEMLLGSGPLRFRGSEADPVVLEGIPAGPRAGTWQGIVVLSSEAPHEWVHAIVRNTSGIDRDGWRLTGGVTLRASEVRIENSVFAGNRAEDALNLIRSRFAFRDLSIREASSDAFDCDFCDGRVIGGRISGIGGDGIDVSGSVVTVEGVALEDIHDKAISVGEGSHLVARRVNIRRVGTAVAGKDGSDVIFQDSKVTDVRHVAIMAYTKKPEYGPGRVNAHNIQMDRVGRRAVAQHGSQIQIDGALQTPEDVDTEALYERGYMKK